ncbi:DUF5957 family protein [Evansella clarkii]|uniref:DUF5957 family protein n=2 Tax=Evansella clarkii TaxID=79879 RepID=UPI0009962965|nr:DUF5957 family protein [Evansella clarkii]
MKMFLAMIVGLIGGFILGIALSSFIGVIGITVFGQAVGIKFLPYYTSLVCAVALPVIEYKRG